MDSNQHHMRFILYISILLFSSCSNSFYKNGLVHSKNQRHAKAIKNFERALKWNPKHPFAEATLGQSYYDIHQYDKAIEHYQNVPNFESEHKTIYQVALCYKLLGDCKNANYYIDKYAQLPSNAMFQSLNPKSFCLLPDKEIVALYNQQKLPSKNLSGLFNAKTYAGDMYVLSKESSESDLGIYYQASLNADFDKVKGNVNSSFNEGPFDFDASTNEMYITTPNIYFDKLDVDKNYKVNLKIVKAKYAQGEWKLAEEFEYNNALYSVGHPAISADGKYMVFVSSQNDAESATDMYICKRGSDGKWMSPERLPEPFNSKYKEVSPGFSSLNNGKYLLSFSSNRPSNNGGYDVFGVEFDGKNWSDIKTFDYPLNSNFNDFSLSFNSEEGIYTVSSDREVLGSMEQMYGFEIKNLVKGKVLDGTLNTNVASSNLIFTNLSTGSVTQVITNDNGEFNLELETQQQYKVIFERDGYQTTSMIIDSKLGYEPNIYQYDILTESIKNEPIVMDEVYFEYNSAIINQVASTDLQKLLNTLLAYSKLKIEVLGFTDSRGKKEYNQILSEKRANAVVDWLIANGIDTARLSWKGLGESALVNNCSDNVNCSEDAHQKNRRTSFKVIE